jgi:hypothetical protein
VSFLRLYGRSKLISISRLTHRVIQRKGRNPSKRIRHKKERMAPMKSTLAPSNTVVTNRDPKGRKFMDIVAAAYDKAGLSDGPKGEAQRINDVYLGELSDLVADFIEKRRVREEYANEEVDSKYGYLSGYKPVDLQSQKAILTDTFPELKGFSPGLLTQIVEGKLKLPANAEGWFAIPNWRKHPEIFGKTYSEAVQKMLDAIKKSRDGAFYNYRDGEVDEQHLRQSARSEKFWEELAKAQGDADILIIAAQFGIRYRGRSVRRARVIMEDSQGEFGLGAFAVGIMILTHPNRLQHYDDLWIDCAGDEFSPDGVGAFSGAPYFRFDGDGVWFDTKGVDFAYDYCGSASGFSPQ